MMSSDKKYGRNKRSPAAKRYLAEARWQKNSRIKQARHAQAVASSAACPTRGAARRAARNSVDWVLAAEHPKRPWQDFIKM